MAKKIQENRSFWNKWKYKYKFTIVREDVYEELASIKLNRFNVLAFVSTFFVLMGVLIFCLIAFTALKQYIPGYGRQNLRKELIEMNLHVADLETEVERADNYIYRLSQLIRDDIDTNDIAALENSFNYDSIDIFSISEQDSLLRVKIEENEQFTIYQNEEVSIESLRSLMIRPVKGIVSSTYDASIEHFGIDIATQKQTPVKSILDGKVLVSSYTVKDGYIIVIVHENGLVSIYKHLSEVLKKVGNLVEGSDVIGRVGNTGENTSGPHLHFELWHNNLSLDPNDYIDFE